MVEGRAPGYQIRDEAKLRRIAAELGVTTAGREVLDIAADVVEACYSDFGSRRKAVNFVSRVPAKRRELWEKLGITPRGVDREIAEMMHRTHMGCDNDAPNTLLHAARCALADGWAGSMIATELCDVLFGTPKPKMSTANLGVIKKDTVNILVHGHNPVVSEMILDAARDPEMVELAKKNGAAGITVAGLCCTGNELLMRQGIPMAGNHLMTELAIVTGAVEVVVVDYQCIMPSLVQVAGCYHTRFIDTASKARFTGAIHFDFHPENAREEARKIVRMAVEAFVERDPKRVEIPAEPVSIMTGFSNEAILEALGGSLDPLLDAVKAGTVRGFVGVVGCNNPKIKHDSANVGLIKALIKKDIMVLATGCVTTAAGKAGLLVPGGASMAGPGLQSLCGALGIPPVLHLGSCVDNARIMFGRLRDFFISQFGLDETEKVLPAWQLESLRDEANRDIVKPEPDFSEHNPNPQQENSTMNEDEIKALQAENTRLKAEANQRAEQEAKNRLDALHTENVSFAEKLLVAGRLTPAAKPVVVAILDAVAGGDKPVEFAEGDTRTPLATAFKTLLDGSAPVLNFGEHATKERVNTDIGATSAEFAEADPERLALHQKALELSKKEGISYDAAVSRCL